MDKKQLFTSAIMQNEGFIYKIAAVYTNSTEDRNDLVQEIIYQLWKSFDSFQHKSSVSTWIYRVALNVALYQIKLSEKKVSTVSIDQQIFDAPDIVDNEQELQWEIFKQQIETLNLLDRGIIMLYLEDKTYDEIAAIIGISKANVGTKLSRIKEKLKSQINKNR